MPADVGAGGSVGSDGTGDVFADLPVVLRDAHGVPVLPSFTVAGEAGPTTRACSPSPPRPSRGSESRP
ncbi:MAG: hypothetical protein ACYCTH_08540, partial [Cellulomonas sp.]